MEKEAFPKKITDMEFVLTKENEPDGYVFQVRYVALQVRNHAGRQYQLGDPREAERLMGVSQNLWDIAADMPRMAAGK